MPGPAAPEVAAEASGVVVGPGLVATLRAPLDAAAAAAPGRRLVAIDGAGDAWPAERAPDDPKEPELLLLRVAGLPTVPLGAAVDAAGKLRAPAIGAARAAAVGTDVVVVSAALLDAPRVTVGRVVAAARAGQPFAADAALPPGGLGGIVCDASSLTALGIVSGSGIDEEGEPVAVAVDARRLAALVKRTKPGPSRPTATAPAPAATAAGVPRLRAAPPSAEAERLRKLSDSALAEALAAAPAAPRVEALLLTAVAWNPHSAAPWVRLARLYDEAGRFAEAQVAYEAAAALRDEHRAESCALAALALQKRSAFVPAERVARRCLVDEPAHPMSLAVAASARAGRGDFKAAVPELRRALSLDPSLGWIHGVLGAGLAAEGKLPDAIAEYKQAIASTPENAGLHMALAEVYVQQGKLPDAIAVYRAAKAEDPALSLRLGELLVAAGRKDEAKRAFEEALKLDPKNAQAQAALDTLK